MSITGIILPRKSRYWLASPPASWNWGGQNSLTRAMIMEKSYTSPRGELIDVTGLRGGVIYFNFENYEPGIAKDSTFDEQVRALSEQIKVMNAYSLCLHSAMLEKQQTRIDAFGVSRKDVLIFKTNESGKIAGISGEALHDLPSTPEKILMEESWYSPVSIHEETLDSASKKLFQLASQEKNQSIEQAALLNIALDSYQEHDFSLALSNSWTIIEKYLVNKWMDYLLKERMTEDGEIREKGDIKDEIKQARRASVFQIMGLLRITSTVPGDLLDEMNEVRDKRNAWLHRLETPSRETVQKALRISSTILSESTEEKLHIATALSSPVLYSGPE